MTNSFDELSKAVGDEFVPRRESLRRLGLAVTAMVLGPLGFEHAQAGKNPKPSKPPRDPCKAFCTCKNKRQLDQCLKACTACGRNTSRLGGTCGNYFCCESGQVSCGDFCADVAYDPYNCGACGYQCDAPGSNEYGGCLDGSCVYACIEGAVDCNGACTFLDWDANNCGACGNVCAPGATCVSGTCITDNDDCFGGLTLCDGVCTNTSFDPQHCGGCGVVCAAGET